MDHDQSKAGEPADTKSEEAGDHLTSADTAEGSVAHDMMLFQPEKGPGIVAQGPTLSLGCYSCKHNNFTDMVTC